MGLLAIGNEVVEGQITNRNASWLSEQLGEMGASPRYHMSCLDQPEDLKRSLNFLSQHCHLIITTGGLGPTRDDLTKETLAHWMGLSLEFNQEQWQIIEKKLNDRQVQIREGHRRQAMLPENSQALHNDKGVAPGFFAKANSCFIASLPGPPNEMQHMFTSYLHPLIDKNLSPKKDKSLKKWICLGAPESEVAHIAESIVGDEFELGFRLHKPFVEVKVWHQEPLSAAQEKRLNQLTEKLKPWLVGSSIKDIRIQFHKVLSQYENTFVIDHLSHGLLLEKLKEDVQSKTLRYQCFEHSQFRFFTSKEVKNILSHMGIGQNPKQLFISLFPQNESQAILSINEKIFSIDLPRRIPIQSKLGQLYVIEKCFLKVISGE